MAYIGILKNNAKPMQTTMLRPMIASLFLLNAVAQAIAQTDEQRSTLADQQ